MDQAAAVNRWMALTLAVAVLGACTSGGQAPSAFVDSTPAPSSAAAAERGGVGVSAPAQTPPIVRPPSSTGCGKIEVGELFICPGQGTVGTLVHVEARNCADAGAEVQLVLVGNRGETDGTIGSYTLPRGVPDSAGVTVLEFRIPMVLNDVHGEGGGSTTSGRYRIISKPMYCAAELVVTSG
jgi:hypothetical protein